MSTEGIPKLSKEGVIALQKRFGHILSGTGIPYPLQCVLDAAGRDGKEVVKGDSGYKVICPVHRNGNESRPSMHVKYDPGTEKVILNCFVCKGENKTQREMCDTALEAWGLSPADLAMPAPNKHGIVATYDYTDEEGYLLYQRVRFEPKRFLYRRPDPDKDGEDEWLWNLDGVRRVLYNLPGLLAADSPEVLFTEGEKDCEALLERGFIATTSGGATSWRPELAEPLRGRKVVIIPDRDSPGEKFARKVAHDLCKVAASVKICELEFGKDAADFFQRGGTEFQLRTWINAKAKPVTDTTPHIYSMASGPLTEAIQPAKWLWHDRIPADSITMLAGKGGLGKSLMCIDLAARITTGSEWPGSSDKAPCGSVILFTCENNRATSIRRLTAAGGDPGKVWQVGDVFTIDDVIKKAEEVLETWDDVRLIILDPITQFLGRTDSHKNAEVLGALGPLNGFAEAHDVAIVGISHYAKADKTGADDKIIGSIAFTTFARQVWHLLPDDGDIERVLFVAGKSNLARTMTGLSFKRESVVVDGCDTVKVVYDPNPVCETADEVLKRQNYRPGKGEIAKDFLEDVLADGPKEKKAIEKLALQQGITEHTLRRAREELNVTTKQTGKGKTHKSMWNLP